MTFNSYINSFPQKERTSVMADIAKSVGVSNSCVKHWRNGTRKPSIKVLPALIELTGLSIEQLRSDSFKPIQPTSEATD